MSQDSRFGCIGDVRGLGAMLAIELVRDRESREPATDLARKTVLKCADLGLVILACGLYSNVLRVLVPLTASLELAEEGISILERALEQSL
jgi:4-aminobutyrate aminotransferase/(S)-3-amino-2-methylpropionate transaminase